MKNAIEKLSNDKLFFVLESLLPYGLTSHKIAGAVGGHTKKQVIYAFTKLQEQGMITPLLSGASVYAVKNGRPEKPYTLTPKGVSTLNEMGYNNAARLNLDGALDVSHRFCMALVGSQSVSPVQIEKVIPYAQGCNVRADVYVPVGEGTARLIEIEQNLDSNHKSRAVTKLREYGELFATNPPKLIPEVMIVFNLPDVNLGRTLKVWRNALRDAGDLPLTVYYSTLSDFLSAPSFADWNTFERLTPSEKKRGRTEPEEIVEEPLEEHPRNRIPMADLISLMRTDAPLETDDENAERLCHLGTFASFIHQLDFGQAGQTSLYAAHPVNSLGHLREFLHHPSQRSLLRLLRREIRIFNKQSGITMLRHASTHLAWSFLRYFGFGRGGPLTLFVRVPEMGGNISEISFDLLVEYGDMKKPERPEESMKAISWLLSALIVYPEELGLIESGRFSSYQE